MQDNDSFAGGTYPTPPEIEEKTIKAHICLSFDIEEEFPKDWDDDRIIEYIEENLNILDWQNQEIEDIEV